MTLALKNISNCNCFRLSRLYLFVVPGCCYCIGRVFMKASALRWTCGYEDQSIALDLWLWWPEQLMPTRQPTTSSIVFTNVNAVASKQCRSLVYTFLPVFFPTVIDALLDTHRSCVFFSPIYYSLCGRFHRLAYKGPLSCSSEGLVTWLATQYH